jgi:hypothetical protein
MLRRSFTSIPFSNSKNKNLLDILDDIIIEESKNNKIKNKNDKYKICKSCDKIIYNKNIFDNHQEKCFTDQIEDLKKTIETQELKLKQQREDILHELRIKYLLLLIENNNNKYNKLKTILYL